jgi:hypothetical protein
MFNSKPTLPLRFRANLFKLQNIGDDKLCFSMITQINEIWQKKFEN